MNLVRDDETGEWVTQYGRAAIERPNVDANLPPPVIPRKYLPHLARLQAIEDRAGIHKRKRTRATRLAGFGVFLCVLVAINAVTFWIPAYSPGDVRHHRPHNISIASTPWLYNYAHDLSRAWGSLVLWMCLVVLGHMYVAVFSCGRNNPLKSFDGRYKEFALLVVLAVVLFALGPVFVLGSMHIPNTVSTHWVQSVLFHWIDVDGERIDDAHENDVYAMYHHKVGWRFFFAFVHNTLFYIMPFAVALHFNYVEQISKFWDFQRKMATPRQWKTCGLCDVAFLMAVAVAMALVLGFHCWLLYLERLLVIYTIFYAFVGFVVSGVTLLGYRWLMLRWRFWAALSIIIPITRFFNPLTAITQSIIAGILVERVTSLGFHSIWTSQKYHFYRRLYRVWLLGPEAATPKDKDVLAYLPLADVPQDESDPSINGPTNGSIMHL